MVSPCLPNIRNRGKSMTIPFSLGDPFCCCRSSVSWWFQPHQTASWDYSPLYPIILDGQIRIVSCWISHTPWATTPATPSLHLKGVRHGWEPQRLAHGGLDGNHWWIPPSSRGSGRFFPNSGKLMCYAICAVFKSIFSELGVFPVPVFLLLLVPWS